MDNLKEELKRESRRHSKKLIKHIDELIPLPELVKNQIHQEVLYAVLDGYRATAKALSNRNGENQHGTQSISGNK